MSTKTESLRVASDALYEKFDTLNDALYKAVGEKEEAHRGQDHYVGAHSAVVDSARLPEIGEVIEYYVGSARRGNRRIVSVAKITEKSIIGYHFGGEDLIEYDSVTYRLSRTRSQWYRTYLTVEERVALEPLRKEREEALDAYNAAYEKYFDAYQADADQAERELRKARESAQLGFEPSDYYDAYPEVSIKIDGRSGGYEVEISDWSVEDEDTRRVFTVPRSALIDIVAKVIDASINYGEEE